MKILNFGSLNTDYVYEVPHILVGGETVTSLSRNVYPGGKGLNSGVALARAGAPVYFAGTLGEDGEFMLDVLKEAGANTDFVARISGPSGHTFIQVDPEAENCILVYPGSNRKNSREHMDKVLESFSEGDYIVLQNEINDLAYLMERAAQKKMHIVFNPSPCDEIIDTLPLELADYLVVNEAEGALLAGTKEDAPLEALLEALHGKFPKAKFVVTLGGDGAVYSDGEQVIRQEIFRTDAVDTTAAGDTFLGNFVTAISEGMTPGQALEMAAAASSIAVSRKGAASSIPTRAETERKLMP